MTSVRVLLNFKKPTPAKSAEKAAASKTDQEAALAEEQLWTEKYRPSSPKVQFFLSDNHLYHLYHREIDDTDWIDLNATGRRWQSRHNREANQVVERLQVRLAK
jgi:hypothetical protein